MTFISHHYLSFFFFNTFYCLCWNMKWYENELYASGKRSIKKKWCQQHIVNMNSVRVEWTVNECRFLLIELQEKAVNLNVYNDGILCFIYRYRCALFFFLAIWYTMWCLSYKQRNLISLLWIGLNLDRKFPIGMILVAKNYFDSVNLVTDRYFYFIK